MFTRLSNFFVLKLKLREYRKNWCFLIAAKDFGWKAIINWIWWSVSKLKKIITAPMLFGTIHGQMHSILTDGKRSHDMGSGCFFSRIHRLGVRVLLVILIYTLSTPRGRGIQYMCFTLPRWFRQGRPIVKGSLARATDYRERTEPGPISVGSPWAESTFYSADLMRRNPAATRDIKPADGLSKFSI